MANNLLHNAKSEKKSEFWTRYEDIEKEMNAYHEFNKDVFRNKTILCPCDDPAKSEFTKYFVARAKDLGIKRVICTSYAKSYLTQNPLDEEKELPCFEADKHYSHGRIYDLCVNEQFPQNTLGLGWKYLEGDGDFRSEEVTKLRDESDIIITNGPFALFREFLAWIMEAKKEFIIIGNQNAITYKEVFPLIKENKIWLGNGFKGNVGFFKSPYEDTASAGEHRSGMIRVSGVMWFTNIDHGKRHEPLQLMTMEDNLKYNKKLRKKLEKDYGKIEYPHYDNYDAIEVPFTEAIPSDYVPCWYECEKANECPYAIAEGRNNAPALCENSCNGETGVPITFLDKYNPEQFDIVKFRKGDDGKDLVYSKVNKEFTNCSSREREREASATILQNCRQAEENVMELWEYQSPSSTSSLSNSLKSSDSGIQDMQEIPLAQKNVLLSPTANKLIGTVPQSKEKHCISESLFALKCNGIMGVPITFLNRLCLEQFEIIWTTDRGGDGRLDGYKMPHTRFDAPVVNENGKYKRILIRRRRQ